MFTNSFTARQLSRIIVGVFVAAVLLSDRSLTVAANTMIEPAAQATATPTRTQASTGNCVEAAKVSSVNLNKKVCVTGTVTSVTSDSSAVYLKLKSTQFQVISYNLKRDYSSLKGKCIRATGTVKQLGSRLVLALSATPITDCKGKAITLPASTGNTVAGSSVVATATPRPAVTASQPTATTAASGAVGNASGLGKVIVQNDSAYDVNFTLWGPSDQSFGAAAGKSATYQIPVGPYGWTSFINGCQLIPVDNLVVATSHTVLLHVVPWEGECGANLFYRTQ